MTISTLTMNTSMLSTLTKLKQQASDAMAESTSERFVDVGLQLGRLTGTAVNYRAKESSIKSQIETNGVVAARLDQSYTIMGGITTASDSISSSLLSAQKYNDYPELAKSALQQLQGSLNQSVGDLYIFGGKNANTGPIKDVDNGIVQAKQAFNDFLTAIGKAGQPAAVTDVEMAGFLSPEGYAVPPGSPTPTYYSFMSTVGLNKTDPAKAFATTTGWADTWSTASDQETEAKINNSETVQTSISANGKPFRQIVAAYSMLAAIGGAGISEAAKIELTKAASVTLTAGKNGVTALRAVVGTRQNRVEMANDTLKAQQDVVNKAYTALEGVDQTEATQRYLALETQLQAAYTITGRLQKLTILDYL